jgi:hypothetical protein
MLGQRSFAEAPPPGTVARPIADATLGVELYALRRATDVRAPVLTFIACLRAAYDLADGSAEGCSRTREPLPM